MNKKINEIHEQARLFEIQRAEKYAKNLNILKQEHKNMVTMLKMRKYSYHLISQLTESGIHIPTIENHILNVIEIIPMMIVDLEIITNFLQTKSGEQNMLNFQLTEIEKK